MNSNNVELKDSNDFKSFANSIISIKINGKLIYINERYLKNQNHNLSTKGGACNE
ncbi:hypothetical protein [Caloramator sp. ALD01]|uniref:hypothetical protein n=1 Tax=Caloramator sp. ALD01 TaxID=1031288 RepID=UPI0012EB22AE|nr:hypothetical protein [Caloramator sp. ALD01]